jgi:AAA15 family ATPase/GTPase
LWVSSIHLRNIKSFADSGTIALSKGINVLLGANNVGKSILIKALLMLQVSSQSIIPTDLRIGQIEGEIVIDLEDISDGYAFTNIKKDSIGDGSSGKIDIKIGYTESDINNPQIQGTVEMGGTQKLSFSGGGGIISYVEPNNFIYPFLSKRKAVGYAEQVNKANANMVAANLTNIVSKIDRIANPQHPGFEAYKNACEGILGFFVSTFPSATGKQAGIVVNYFDSIPLLTFKLNGASRTLK